MTTVFSSVKDFGYQQALTGDRLVNQAQYALDNFVGFPETLADETKTDLYAGYQLRFAENNPAKIYAVVNDHYVLATDEQVKNKKIEKIEIGVAYAYSYSSQEFGKLKNTNPALHGIVGSVREKFSTYASNKLGDLKREAKKILNSGKTSTRTTMDFVQSMTKIFDAQGKSVKVKQDRGDTTANALKYKMAIKAFWDTYNK
jgi:hypothetical protein